MVSGHESRLLDFIRTFVFRWLHLDVQVDEMSEQLQQASLKPENSNLSPVFQGGALLMPVD